LLLPEWTSSEGLAHFFGGCMELENDLCYVAELAAKEQGIELSVVMPCLNEALTVGVCIDKALGAFKKLGVIGEVIVADNGSTDSSVRVARMHGARVVRVTMPGYGSALRGGIEAARGRYVVMGDADDSYDFSQLEAFLVGLRAGDDLVMGNRFQGGIKRGAMPWLHRYVGNPLLSGLLNLLFATPARDAHCGLRAFQKESYLRLGLKTTGMEFASEMLVKAAVHQQRISEVPTVLYPDGRNRPPHLRSFRDGWRHLCLLMQLCPRRLLFVIVLLFLTIGVLSWPAKMPQVVARDLLVAPFWLLATALIAFASWLWARRLFPQDSGFASIGHALVLFWSSVVAVATVVGSLNCLNGSVLVVAGIMLSAVALAAYRVLPAVPLSGPKRTDPGNAWYIAMWAAVLSWAIGHVVTKGLLGFPTDFDSLAYHIPLVDLWLQGGTLNATGCSRWANPGNNELLALWMVAPFSGDFYVALTNLLPTALFACSIVSVATAMGLARPLAHLVGLTCVCNFVVLRQLADNENDIAVAACFFAATSYAMRYSTGHSAAVLALGAISLGLLAGIKYYALGYVGLVLVSWLAVTIATDGIRASLKLAFVIAAGIVIFGGYWYCRNWQMTGSPLYPKQLFGTSDLLSEICPFVAQTSFLGNGRPELPSLYIEAVWNKVGLYQVAALLFAPLSLLGLLVSAAWHALKGDAPDTRARFWAFLLLVGTALVFGATPMAIEDVPGTLNQLRWGYTPLRYGLCFLSMTTLVAFLTFGRFLFHNRDPEKNGAVIAWAAPSFLWMQYLVGCAFLAGLIGFQVSLAVQQVAARWLDNGLIASVLVSCALALWVLYKGWPWLGKSLVLLVGLALLMFFVGATAFRSEQWHNGFVSQYVQLGLYPTQLNDVDDHTICVLHSRCYPFFGSLRQRRVWQPVYVYSSAWLWESLRRENAAYIVVQWPAPSQSLKRFLGFEECMTTHPAAFRQVDGVRRYAVFEVLQFKQHESNTRGDQ
jgi:hypothetical protein